MWIRPRRSACRASPCHHEAQKWEQSIELGHHLDIWQVDVRRGVPKQVLRAGPRCCQGRHAGAVHYRGVEKKCA
jgi:hypothetical protein